MYTYIPYLYVYTYVHLQNAYRHITTMATKKKMNNNNSIQRNMLFIMKSYTNTVTVLMQTVED